MGKGRYSEIPVQDELRSAKYGGAKPAPAMYLTATQVQYALDNSVNNDPKFKNANPNAVAHEVKEYLVNNKLVQESSKQISVARGGIEDDHNRYRFEQDARGRWIITAKK